MLRYVLYGWAAKSVRTGDSETDRRSDEVERERVASLIEPLLERMLKVMTGAETGNEALDKTDADLGTVLEIGLHHRLGLFLHPEIDLHLYSCLCLFDPAMPAGLAVCEACNLVFAPRRQTSARKCAHCHHRKSSRPTGWRREDDGSLIFQVPDGQGVRKIGHCAACGGTFFAKRTNAIFCSDGCRKGRTPTRPLWSIQTASDADDESFVEDFTNPLQLTLTRVIQERRAGGLRNAACDRCHRYYRTDNPAQGRCPDCEGEEPCPQTCPELT